jgi:nucleotide-binding universal stress UspA family protein
MPKILVCTDFSAASAAGEREAARRFPDSTLVVFHATDRRLLRHVADMTGLDAERLYRESVLHADQRLADIIERLESQGRSALAELVDREGDPVEQTLAAAEKHAVEMIVLGIDAEEVGRFRVGLARRARVPVLLIPGDEE